MSNNKVEKTLAEKMKEWSKKYHTPEQLPDGEVEEFIEGILYEGVSGIGSLSGVGKTLIDLSMTRALLTGEPLFGVFPVKQTCSVLYLCPEMMGKRLRKRCKTFGVPMNGVGVNGNMLLIQSMEDGITQLNDPMLADIIATLKPVVFLDTAIRFITNRKDENSSAENSALANALFRLMNLGAKAVVFLHHSPKSSNKEAMSLENMFRGTGDIGAMCDLAFGIRWDDGANKGAVDESSDYYEQSKRMTRLFVKNLKPRDDEPVPAFRIQGRPYINEQGDFKLLDGIVGDNMDDLTAADTKQTRLVQALRDNPKASKAELCRKSGYHRNWIDKAIQGVLWEEGPNRWQPRKIFGHADPLPSPYVQ